MDVVYSSAQKMGGWLRMFLALSKVDSVKFENSKAVYGRAKCLVCYRRAPLRSWELGEDDEDLFEQEFLNFFLSIS